MSDNKSNRRVRAIRGFNRFYTKKIGVLRDRLLDTPYTLSQARVLFELAQRQDLTASTLTDMLHLDAGYVSRILTAIEKMGLIKRIQPKSDGRKRILKLSREGQKVFTTLNRRSSDQVKALLNNVTEENQIRLTRAMSAVEDILSGHPIKTSPIVLRTHRPGDIGWIVQRHGALYNEEYRFDETFEALVADILAKLIKTYDHKKEHIWIAEIDGERVGSIVLTKANLSTAKLRLFLVEPWARGRGIGKMLIKECIIFARQAGYRKTILWTQSILHAARQLYEEWGFRLVAEEPHTSFGHDLIAETWEVDL
jgi:DNA-binding MarR family transcriptional regulator/GNAT superfamily N-acetyltransferase